MKRRRNKLLSQLKRIAAHFNLNVSKTEILKKAAFALDVRNSKLLVIDDKDNDYFKTIDVRNIDNCAIKVDYRSINAGEMPLNSMDNFIERIQLQIVHLDPKKSVRISFYDTNENHVKEVTQLIKKATSWRDAITAMLPARASARA
jgi:hypothetical protein